MTRRLAFVAVPTLIASVLVNPQATTGQSGPSILIAAPFEGHSGDTIYLSGSGLDPRVPLNFFMACPNWHDPSVARYGNLKFDPDGTTTDGHGQFVGYPYQVLALHHFKLMVCQIYVEYGSNPFGPDFPALYTILPPGTAAPPCARHICVHVKASPLHVRAAQYENISIQHDQTGPWPGARADVSVSYSDGRTQSEGTTLNMKGDGLVRIRIDPHANQTVPASVRVRVRMGGMAGNGRSNFVVVH